MKDKTFILTLVTVTAVFTVLTVVHVIYAVNAYGTSSVIRFIAGEIW